MMDKTTESREKKVALKKAQTGIDEAMIDRLVRHFYAKIQTDSILGPIFNERIVDWEPHLLKMIDFWSSATLKTGKYKGNPLIIHNPLPIDGRFFDHWLELFNQAAREICSEQAALVFKEKSELIARSLELGIAINKGTLPLKDERYIDQSLNFPK
ncbi:MAG: group III truncated hemoglobin [Emcibacteraceae bacterium]|nr:group III truncated hemoglobin [Emcibacteraceae bacterium]